VTARRARGPLRLTALALALSLAPWVAGATGTGLAQLSVAGAAPSDRAPLDLWVNGGHRGTVSVLLRGDDVLAAVEDLEFAGLQGFGGVREIIDGRPYVSLTSLAPAIRFVVDEAALALRVTATAEALGRSRVDLRARARPPGLEIGRDPSAFANYAIQHDTGGRTRGSLEVGASAAGRLLYGSGQLLPDGTTVRGMTNLTLDDTAALRRVIVGDAYASSFGLGGALLLGGVSISREYGLDPYRVRAPLPSVTGFAPTPSTLEIYVNGVLRREVQLPPGSYDVSNLPVIAGAGNVQTVLRDAYGRSEAVSWRYYYTPTLLARGDSDYGYALGFRRRGFGAASFEYGGPVLVARHRLGALDGLSVGARLEAGQGFVSGGPSATVGLPVGTLDLEAAASGDGGDAGAAGSLGYGFTSPWFGAGTLLRVMSDRYANAALAAHDDRPRVQWTSYAGAPVARRVNLSLSHSTTRPRDGDPYDTLSLRADVGLGREVTLGVSGSRTRTGPSVAFDVFATISWAFAPLSVAEVGAQRGDGGKLAEGYVQRALPLGTGYGYRARAASTPAGNEASALAQAQWDHGRYELQYDRVGDREIGTASAAGGIVVAGGRAFLTRPVQDGYALVRIGVPGVRAYAEGQEVGRTDRRGDLLVPSLLPYYGNRIGIADRDVPVDYEVGGVEQLAAPPYRGVAVTRFPVSRLRAAQGTLSTDAGVPPAYGDLTVRVEGRSLSGDQAQAFATSPVGGDGRFYLQGLPAGAHQGLVDWSGGRCSVLVEVPAEPAFVDLGTVRCVGGSPKSEPEPTPTPTPIPDPTTTTTTTPTPTTEPEPDPDLVPTAPRASMPPRPSGFGPRSTRCPSCGTCFSAALGRRATPTARARCVEDLTAMTPGLDARSADAACAAFEGWDQVCDECIRIRADRGCPAWPAE
jgi:outer membrane usher protein